MYRDFFTGEDFIFKYAWLFAWCNVHDSIVIPYQFHKHDTAVNKQLQKHKNYPKGNFPYLKYFVSIKTQHETMIL